VTRLPKHECAYCGQGFSRISDHMVHVVKEHDPSESATLRRSVSCWRCAIEMKADVDGQFKCVCGFVLPDREQIAAAAQDSPTDQRTDCSWAALKDSQG
jgi:hypothetical protein